MNGTKRAETMMIRETFIARIIAAMAEFGETMTLVTKPQKGRPLTHFQTADGLTVKFDLLQPNGATGMWQVLAHHGYNKSYGRLDLVDVKPIAEIIVRPIADQRAQAASEKEAGKLRSDMPSNSPMRLRAGPRGGLFLDIRDPMTVDQAATMIVAARACGILPPAQRAAAPVTRPTASPYLWSPVPGAEAAGAAAYGAARGRGVAGFDAWSEATRAAESFARSAP